MDEKQGFIDRFTRQDELLAEMVPLLKQIVEKEFVVSTPDTDGVTLDDVYGLLKEQRDSEYEIFYLTHPSDGTLATFDAGTTVLDYNRGTIKTPAGVVSKMSTSLYEQGKSYMRSLAINCNKDVVVQLDTNDKTPVVANTWLKQTYKQFTEVFITCAVETKGFVQANTNPHSIVEMIGESVASSPKVALGLVKGGTGTGSIYASEIVQNAYATEDIILHESSDLYTIKHITIMSAVALNFRLHFFTNDDFNTTFDNTGYVGYVDLDLTTYGAQIAGAGTYYLDVAGLNIGGIDEDATGEMHIALQNLSATTKQTIDKVMLDIYYEPRTPMVGM